MNLLSILVQPEFLKYIIQSLGVVPLINFLLLMLALYHKDVKEEEHGLNFRGGLTN